MISLLSKLDGFNHLSRTRHEGRVDVSLTETSDFVQLAISDTGKGIPPEVLPRLGQYGVTFGKQGGHGLGLYHAKSTLEAWGSSLTVQSELGKGTTVLLALTTKENGS